MEYQTLGGATMNDKCTWENDGDGNWDTQCGNAFSLNDGMPSENGMVYCCFCGKKIVEIFEDVEDVQDDEDEE